MKVPAALAFLGLATAPAAGQKAEENITRQARDAFGTSIGNEQVGLYTPGTVRGFSAIAAGNVRLDGLYFDQQAALSDRLVERSSMRVGISAQSYLFPAPTGIADYQLRKPGERFEASFRGGGTSWGGGFGEVDLEWPIAGDELSLGGGVGYVRDATHYGTNPTALARAATLRWRPADGVEILPFWSRTDVRDDRAYPLIFTSGGALPPRIPRRRFFGQKWTENEGALSNHGLISKAEIGRWQLRLGLFRSETKQTKGFADLFLNAKPDGTAAHVIIADPPKLLMSTSGEALVSRSFDEGRRRHRLSVSMRARKQTRRYGGSATVALGEERLGLVREVPKPDLAFRGQSRDEVRQHTIGLAYQGQWDRVGELSLGLQKTGYRKTVAFADGLRAPTRDKRWLFYGTAAVHLSPSLALYIGHTRGLEESATAPEIAVNKDSAPPAIHTLQTDGGLRWVVTDRLKLIAGLFDVRKPYYNLDENRVFGRLGNLRHRGVEISLAGEPIQGLNLIAGAVLLDAEVSGRAVEAGLIQARPVASVKRMAVLNIDYRVRQLSGLSVDALVEFTGDRAANSVTELRVPARAVLALGARYRFTTGKTSAQLRVQASNLFNTFGWNVGPAGNFTYVAPRRLTISLTGDF